MPPARRRATIRPPARPRARLRASDDPPHPADPPPRPSAPPPPHGAGRGAPAPVRADRPLRARAGAGKRPARRPHREAEPRTRRAAAQPPRPADVRLLQRYREATPHRRAPPPPVATPASPPADVADGEAPEHSAKPATRRSSARRSPRPGAAALHRPASEAPPLPTTDFRRPWPTWRSKQDRERPRASAGQAP